MSKFYNIIEGQARKALSDCTDIVCEQVMPGVKKQTVHAVRCAGETIVSASPASRQDVVEMLGAIGAAYAWQLRLDPPDAALLLEQGTARAAAIYAEQVTRGQGEAS